MPNFSDVALKKQLNYRRKFHIEVVYVVITSHYDTTG